MAIFAEVSEHEFVRARHPLSKAIILYLINKMSDTASDATTFATESSWKRRLRIRNVTKMTGMFAANVDSAHTIVQGTNSLRRRVDYMVCNVNVMKI